MNLLSIILIISIYTSLCDCNPQCYKNYGCYIDRYDIAVPDEPSKINTTFFLYTRSLNKEKKSEVISTLSIGSYDSNLKTKFIIHGFRHDSKKSWILEMKDTMLEVEDLNVILVDWSNGNGHPYSKAAGNTRIVGVDISNLIENLITSKQAKYSDFHLIGYSLGAHVAGIAGHASPGLDRITGLDPSSVFYKELDNELRLSKDDAEFVDVIHTDGSPKLGLGSMWSSGDVDFYPNGGKNQPGCPSSNSKIFSSAWAWLSDSDKEARFKFSCSHRFSRRFFIDSIKNECNYTAYPCESHDQFNEGNCLKCSDKGCNQMGYWATKSKDLGNLYLNTKSYEAKKSFCKQFYQVKLLSNNLDSQDDAKGWVKIYWKTANSMTPAVKIKHQGLELEPNTETRYLYELDQPINEDIEEVFIQYKRTSNYLLKYFYDQYWSFKHVEIFSADSQKSYKFCPISERMKSSRVDFTSFKKC
jgi:pancreatic lipase-related protein 1